MQELGDDSLVGCSTSGSIPKIVEDEGGNDSESWDDENDDFERELSYNGSDVDVLVSVSSAWYFIDIWMVIYV